MLSAMSDAQRMCCFMPPSHRNACIAEHLYLHPSCHYRCRLGFLSCSNDIFLCSTLFCEQVSKLLDKKIWTCSWFAYTKNSWFVCHIRAMHVQRVVWNRIRQTPPVMIYITCLMVGHSCNVNRGIGVKPLRAYVICMSHVWQIGMERQTLSSMVMKMGPPLKMLRTAHAQAAPKERLRWSWRKTKVS